MANLFSESWLDWHFRFYAYTVGKLYLTPIYFFGLFIPMFRQILHDYETNRQGNSKFIISITTGSGLFAVFCYVTYSIDGFVFTFIQYLFWYAGYFVWGYFALFLLTDYEQRKQDDSTATGAE